MSAPILPRIDDEPFIGPRTELQSHQASHRAANQAIRNALSTTNILAVFQSTRRSLTARKVCAALDVPRTRAKQATSRLRSLVRSNQLIESNTDSRNPTFSLPPPVVEVEVHVEPPNLNRRRLCVICMDRERDILLLPCRHLAVCDQCWDRPEVDVRCPVCRQEVDEEIVVLFA